MKKILVAVFVGISALVSAQQTENRSVSSFKGIKVAEGIDVYLKKGEKEAVRVEVTGIKTSAVITEVSGDYLKIHMQEGRYKDRTVKVYVTYVEVNRLSASSASNIFAENPIKTKSLILNASSAGTIDLEVDVDDLEASASSAADLELKGKAKKVLIEASSAGEVDAYELAAETVEAEASSAGAAKVSVTKEIRAEASSGGSIRYKGNPERSNTNSSSGGSVKKSN
ncbi:MAG TPA: head GIN domain-containing protein [Cyclobacteriaceae bacterium]|nr:head GIN domain-containing protein [Cyclobacteriaceae bacterium]